MKTLGLDEAGRGCVLGPLVVGAFCFEGDDDELVRAAGATDSKKLSAKKRQHIRGLLPELGHCEIIEVSPAAIDSGNINQLEEAAFLELIRRHRPDRVIIDAPTHPRGIPAFCRRLQRALHESNPPFESLPELIVQPKADLHFPICGAASIVAKVHRDDLIEDLKALGDIGSGYPSDPKTRSWLTGFLIRGEPFPSCVRQRWGTIDKLRQQQLL